MKTKNWIHRNESALDEEHNNRVNLYIDIEMRHTLDATGYNRCTDGTSAWPFRGASNMALFRQSLSDDYDRVTMFDDVRITQNRRIRRSDYTNFIGQRMHTGPYAPQWRYDNGCDTREMQLIKVLQNRVMGKVFAGLGNPNVTMRYIFDTITTYGQQMLNTTNDLGILGHILKRNGGKAAMMFNNAFNTTRDSEIPWRSEYWWRLSALRFLLAPRASEKFPGLIAYYQSADKMERDVLTPIKVGKFLGKYFPNLPADDIRHWSAQWDIANRELVLHFTDTTTHANQYDVEHQWRRIYNHGPHSCMRGHEAVRVYAKADNTLRLAYMTEDNEPDGKPIARCIVRDDEMEWVRIYPEDSGRIWNGMKKKLELLGYRHGGLEGIRLQLIEDAYGYVCPYIDYGGDGGTQNVEVRGDYLLITEDGSYDGATASGHVGASTRMECDECGCRLGEDEAQSDENGDGYYCESCFEDIFCYAIGRNGRSYTRRQEYCIKVNGRWYVEQSANDNGVHQCDDCGEWFVLDDMVGVMGGLACNDCAVELDVEDSDGNTHALTNDTAETYDGRTIRDDDAVEIVWADGNTYTLHKDDDPLEFLPEVDDPNDTARVNIDAELGEEYEHATA